MGSFYSTGLQRRTRHPNCTNTQRLAYKLVSWGTCTSKHAADANEHYEQNCASLEARERREELQEGNAIDPGTESFTVLCVLPPDWAPIFYVDHVSCASCVFWPWCVSLRLVPGYLRLIRHSRRHFPSAAAVVVFAFGRRINSRLFTPGILWGPSPWSLLD